VRFMIVPDNRVGLTDAAVVDWLIRMQRELRLLLATRRRNESDGQDGETCNLKIINAMKALLLMTCAAASSRDERSGDEKTCCCS